MREVAFTLQGLGGSFQGSGTEDPNQADRHCFSPSERGLHLETQDLESDAWAGEVWTVVPGQRGDPSLPVGIGGGRRASAQSPL